MEDKILTFIKEYISQHCYSPTVREISKGTGFKSTQSVFCSLRKLREQGKITFVDGQPRTIVLCNEK